MIRLAIALFAIQAGFYGFTAALPLALDQAGLPDPEIGLIVGTAAVVQFPAAFLAGALVDRFGGTRMIAAGGAAYLLAALLLALPGFDPATNLVPVLVARLFQGVGIATVLPAALSLVPGLVPAVRRGFGLAFVGSAQNLTPVFLPSLSLAVLSASSLAGVAAVMAAIVAVGLVVAFARPFRAAPGSNGTTAIEAADDPGADVPDHATRGDGLPPARRRLGFAFRRTWLSPLAIVLLYVAHWGVVTAYLPQRAHAAGADIGLFFVADGIAILALRVPSGWLADRIAPRWLILPGLAVTSVAIGLLVLPPTTPILIVAGMLTGSGGGLILSPLLVEISRRSAPADQGSAFALFSGALAGALILGSIGGAPIIAVAGFEAAVIASIGGLACSAVLTMLDAGLAQPARATTVIAA
jgi:MFS family permease